MTSLKEKLQHILDSEDRNLVRIVAAPLEEDIGDIQGAPSKCHSNVDRWVAKHPGDRAVRGFIYYGSGMFDKHSVVDSGNPKFRDVTPRLGSIKDEEFSFVIWDTPDFENLPDRID